ncbi:hypothetical protein BDR04DRAFT_1007027, partial [Suillus decipiens]
VKLTKTLPKHLTGLLICLHTHHTLLNKYLHHIGKSPTPFYPHCPNSSESVHHFLITC